MKKTRDFRFNISIVVLFIIFNSCSKEIIIDIPSPESKPVLNCLFTNDSIFKVHLSRSTSVFDEPFAFKDGEDIKLFIKDDLADSLVWNNGFYRSVITPRHNIPYRIEWKKEGKVITSTDYIPDKVSIGPSFFRDSVSVDEEGNYISQLKIEIRDTSIKKKFFELKLITILKPSDDFGPDLARAWYLDSSDPVIDAEGLLDYYPRSLVFSDKLFNNKSYVLTVNFQSAFHISEMYLGQEYDLIVKLYFISENYYKYKKALIIHTYNQNSDIWDGMGNPVPMFTNIEGGYGIFAGYAIDVDTLTKQ